MNAMMVAWRLARRGKAPSVHLSRDGLTTFCGKSFKDKPLVPIDGLTRCQGCSSVADLKAIEEIAGALKASKESKEFFRS